MVFINFHVRVLSCDFICLPAGWPGLWAPDHLQVIHVGIAYGLLRTSFVTGLLISSCAFIFPSFAVCSLSCVASAATVASNSAIFLWPSTASLICIQGPDVV